MVKPKRIGHLVLNVRDVEVSEKFYTEILGFEIALKRPQRTFLTCGRIHHDLALFEVPEADKASPASPVGLNHFAVQIENLDELKEVYERLKANGVTIDRTVDHGMTGSVYFFDPDGNRIEFFYNMQETAEEGLAIMRAASRQNTELVLEDAPVA
jgi:catechol 2,3-dioxygenase